MIILNSERLNNVQQTTERDEYFFYPFHSALSWQYSKARENRTHIDWRGKTDTFTFLSENIGHLISILENLIRIKELMSL